MAAAMAARRTAGPPAELLEAAVAAGATAPDTAGRPAAPGGADLSGRAAARRAFGRTGCGAAPLEPRHRRHPVYDPPGGLQDAVGVVCRTARYRCWNRYRE